jgi:hypothetical protein
VFTLEEKGYENEKELGEENEKNGLHLSIRKMRRK